MKKIFTLFLIVSFVFGLSACGTGEAVLPTTDTSEPAACRIYECDYKSLNLNTKITTTIDGTDITISGNVFRLLTDPLTVKDSDGNVMGYAGDAYGIISQDDHGIYVGDTFEINMCGNVDFLGNSYELKDSQGNVVATAEFNTFNTKGTIVDTNGVLIAKYSSGALRNDYTVAIYDNAICSDMAILMIMASYVSDYQADSKK